MLRNFPRVISLASSSPNWYARFCKPFIFSINCEVVRLPNSCSNPISSFSNSAIHLGEVPGRGTGLLSEANSETPGICSGHRSGEDRSNFSKLNRSSSPV